MSFQPEPVAEEEEVLDWDFAIETAPPHPGGLIEVTLQFDGRDEPFPEDDPWAGWSLDENRSRESRLGCRMTATRSRRW